MRAILIAALIVAFAAPLSAQDFLKGWAAYESGDYATALKEWKPLAEQGAADAQYNLGVMYDKGRGVPQNNKDAVKWYRLAAEQGNANAQFNLGNMYYNGQGVLQDYKEAAKWYRLAAEQGDAMAQNNLGVMYDNGQGVLQDNVLAHIWFNLGAANGNEVAGKNRDIIAKRMTSSAIEKAQAMARKCMNSDYQDCGY
jgi:uncharacterized protein